MNTRLHLLALIAITSSFSFTNVPQNVLPNTVSKPIVVSLAQPTTETFDLSFQSTSPTALFLSATDGPVSKIMARGTKTRTFYYRDSTLGQATITITAIGRVSKQIFSASQKIIIASTTLLIISPQSSFVKSISPKATSTAQIYVATTSDYLASTNGIDIVYTENKKPDTLADFLIIPQKFWHWILSIF